MAERGKAKDMSTLLLQGWTMREISCPFGCYSPLVEDRRNKKGTLLCCTCGKELSEEEYESIARRGSAPESAAPTETGKESAEPPSKRSAASELVGQKLLQGFTMLCESCPTCNTPLVRKGEDPLMLCVACEVQYLHPNDYNPDVHAPANVSAVEATRKDEKTSASVHADKKAIRGTRGDAEGGRTETSKSSGGVAPCRDDKNEMRVEPSYTGLSAHEAVTAALERKLLQVARALDSISIVCDDGSQCPDSDLMRINRLASTANHLKRAIHQ